MAIAGPLERAIMEALWDAQNPLLIRELMEKVNAGSAKRSAYTTVQTVADRLVQKGFLSRTADRNAWRYAPTRSREDHVAQVMAEALAETTDRGPVLARFAETIDPRDAHRLLVELAQRSAPTESR
ncbi:BlaI/MecI/CopY family transcriptional regulator [Actinoallomurus sp. NPDC050550]|uniref:BlaI/MecI/CopY family transcriptional regulator n=1 Tax=Actinoallomurus sp. NPDC050550 TaxID=3154937 RepID=UPI0033D9B268